jgi:deoxyribonuclease V
MNKEKLISIQERLKAKRVLEDGFKEIRLIGGADISYSEDYAHCTVTILDCHDMVLTEAETSVSKVTFPYVPTFLSFREADPMIKTFRRLKEKPDVLLIDGQGIAHPRGMGLATHVGVLLNFPTIGVAKKVLVGNYSPPEMVSEAQKIVYQEKVVGFAIKSRKGSKPIFVSPGHKVSLSSSLEIVTRCLKGHRLPEPLMLAHQISKKASKDMVSAK